MITEDATPDLSYLDAVGALLTDDTLDPAFRALALALPSEDDLAQTLATAGRTPDPDLIHTRREAMQLAMAQAHATTFAALYDQMAVSSPYRPLAEDAAKRALRLKALSALTRTQGTDHARTLFNAADNMTESLGALAILLHAGAGEEERATFYHRWKNDPNTLDKWFSLQVVQSPPDEAVATAKRLTEHPRFDWKNPNRFRAVLGGLAGNTAGFHDKSGAGYALFADWLAKLDPINPMTAARMATVFETWSRYDGDRQGQMRDALERLLSGTPSRDMTEIASRILGK